MGKRQPKIYFACSIRGGRQDQKLYFEIIQLLKKYGHVISEHFGDQDLNPDENVNAITQHESSDRHIHDLDMSWIEGADVLVAEVSRPSLGCGYEIAKAEDLGKPILALFRDGNGYKLSAMIAGSTLVSNRTYQEISDLEQTFKEFFGQLSHSP